MIYRANEWRLQDEMGSLDYVSFVAGSDTVCLDGDFTIEQLRAIANFIEEENTK